MHIPRERAVEKRSSVAHKLCRNLFFDDFVQERNFFFTVQLHRSRRDTVRAQKMYT